MCAWSAAIRCGVVAPGRSSGVSGAAPTGAGEWCSAPISSEGQAGDVAPDVQEVRHCYGVGLC
jgi:hypothetical protein